MSKRKQGWVVKPNINWIKELTFYYVTVPIELLDKADLKHGDKIIFSLEGGNLTFKKEDK